MTIWILAILVIGLLALVGFFLGAIRSAVVLLGVLLGGVLAVPLGPSLRPLFTACGVTNTVWLWIWPPVAVFGLVFLIFFGLSFAAHYPVAKHYKFTTDAVGVHRWQRMNSRLGACLSLVSGVLCVFFFSAAVYGPGYLSVQFAKEEGDPIWLSFINKARQDLPATGLDRVGAAWDPLPKQFYPVCDILGILYYNWPGIRGRLSEYPPFLNLEERQEFTDMAGDKEFTDAISGKANTVDLIGNPRVLGLINNAEIVGELSKLDLNDFRTYLEKGKSAKYDPLKVLGRWAMDGDPLVSGARKSRTDLTPADLSAIRSAASIMAAGTTIKATTDNKFTLVMKGSYADLKTISVPKNTGSTVVVATTASVAPQAPPPPRQGYGGVSGMSAEMRRRYGASYAANPPGGQPAPEGAPVVVPIVRTNAPLLRMETKTLQGSWEVEGNYYQFTLRDPAGKEETCDVRVDQDTMSFTAMGQPFVFNRQWQ